MSSRDNILQRIRTELQKAPAPEQPPVPEVWPRVNPSSEQLVEQFTTALEQVDGEVIRCGSMDEARRKVTELAEQLDAKPVGAVDCPACRDLLSDFPADRVAWTRDGWDPKQMAQLPAGLVAAELLLADTGTCVVVNDTAEQRLMCYLPPVCLVVARVDRLFEHMPAAWEEIARRTAEPQQRGEFVFITGPSRTADIEKILILGVHGPRRLMVILVG